MSNNPQWKTFQPPIMNSDPAILDYKSMAIPSPKAITEYQPTTNNYRNGTNYSGDHIVSPPECKNSTNYGSYPGTQSSPRNGATRFPFEFTGMETNAGYTNEPATSNSTYQDQSANQGTRETGIIEKLLVSTTDVMGLIYNYEIYKQPIYTWFLFNSILTDSYSAVKDRQDCFFILANLAVILNI